MPIPSQPTNLIPRPFASSEGATYQVIPDKTETPGRASFQQGFPAETQLPLSSGGIAPNRMDFQGLFHLLTAFGFWQQSGGLWEYNKTLNYAPPAVVYHKDTLWWCEKDNGPDVEGAKEPGTDDGADYWRDFLSYLTGSSGGASVLGNPVGTVIMYYGVTAPNGYLACDGQEFEKSQYPELAKLLGSESDDGSESDEKCKVPDLRGYFIRGYDTRNTVDPDGRTRAIGSTQGDAIRNITGTIDEAMWYTPNGNTRGVFSGGWWAAATIPYKSSSDGWQKGSYDFNASRVVPTAAENRPVNVCLLYCIKHD